MEVVAEERSPRGHHFHWGRKGKAHDAPPPDSSAVAPAGGAGAGAAPVRAGVDAPQAQSFHAKERVRKKREEEEVLFLTNP